MFKGVKTRKSINPVLFKTLTYLRDELYYLLNTTDLSDIKFVYRMDDVLSYIQQLRGMPEPYRNTVPRLIELYKGAKRLVTLAQKENNINDAFYRKYQPLFVYLNQMNDIVNGIIAQERRSA